jgi:tetratricopeptide (TPR) repeat protein
MLEKTANKKLPTALIAALLFLLLAPGLRAAPDPVAEADGLLSSPTLDLRQALRALDLYDTVLARHYPPRAPLLIRLTRACFVIGELTLPSQRHKYYEKGRDYAKLLLKEQPKRVEGHYWLALNCCGMADVGGMMEGRRLLPRIMEELQRALVLDESYDQAGSHRVLGRIFYEAPAWPFSVGDLQKSLAHLSRAVTLAPDNSTNHLYLAETLLRLHRQDQARRELEKVLTSTNHALPLKGLEEDRRSARRLLQKTANLP